MSKKRQKKPSKSLSIISIILTLISLLLLTIFTYLIFKINIIPTKYLIVGYVLFVLITTSLLLVIFGKGKILPKIISLFLLGIFSLGLIYAIYYLNNTYNFLESTQSKYETVTYSVVVLKSSSYDSISDLDSKTILLLEDDNYEEVKEELTSKLKFNEEKVTDFTNMADSLLTSKTDSICIEESYLNLINEELETFEDSTSIIYTFNIKIASHQEEEELDVTKNPFILYISGIDQYGNVNSVRGRSDVNQLVVVNPKTNHVLLVNTPRDYYVQLANTTGLKDKLTHAGIYGIDKSIETLEDLYDIDINYYLRVNFNTLVKVVDVIGGIDIYSDIAFTPWTNQEVYVNQGWNHMDGKTALAYARERKAYTTGDNQRGLNQQQVITAIIDKVTSSTVLISKYNSILNALESSFQTDIDTKTITSFIKYQLEKMPSWNVESIAVTGTNSYNYTYSMGINYKLYVMEPNQASITKAITKIEAVLNEE